MWVDGGFCVVYCGFGLGFIGMFLYSVIDIGIFEFLKKKYIKIMVKYYGIYEEDVKIGNVVIVVFGVFFGVFGVIMVYFLNVFCIWL